MSFLKKRVLALAVELMKPDDDLLVVMISEQVPESTWPFMDEESADQISNARYQDNLKILEGVSQLLNQQNVRA